MAISTDFKNPVFPVKPPVKIIVYGHSVRRYVYDWCRWIFVPQIKYHLILISAIFVMPGFIINGVYRIRQLHLVTHTKKMKLNFDIWWKKCWKRRQRKNIIIPRNVMSCAKMLLGKPIRLISEKIMHMNHYKFLNKPETHNWRRNLIHPSTNNKIIRYL